MYETGEAEAAAGRMHEYRVISSKIRHRSIRDTAASN